MGTFRELPYAAACENDLGRGNEIPDLLTPVDDHGLEAELGEFVEEARCWDVESCRPRAVLMHRVGTKESGFNGGSLARCVDEARDGDLLLTIEGGRPTGGDRPNALNIALEGEGVGPFDGAFRAPQLVSPFLLPCLRGGDKASSADDRANQEQAGETTCGNKQPAHRFHRHPPCLLLLRTLQWRKAASKSPVVTS
jgi:hypothetical protein